MNQIAMYEPTIMPESVPPTRLLSRPKIENTERMPYRTVPGFIFAGFFTP